MAASLLFHKIGFIFSKKSGNIYQHMTGVDVKSVVDLRVIDAMDNNVRENFINQ